MRLGHYSAPQLPHASLPSLKDQTIIPLRRHLSRYAPFVGGAIGACGQS